jgi:hypothetical protein
MLTKVLLRKKNQRAVLLVLAASLYSCAGGVITTQPAENKDSGTSAWAAQDFSGWLLDQKTDQALVDIGANSSLDSIKQYSPEAGLASGPLDKGSPPPGGPCPCPSTQECVEKICYLKCTRSGACNAITTCPLDQACLELNNKPGTRVCDKAVAVGAACGGPSGCPNGFVCGESSSNKYICVPPCPVIDAACGATGAGICLEGASANCNFCSAP